MSIDMGEKLQKIILGHDELKEVITPKELRECLNGEALPTSMWGVSPTGILHFGFDRFILKQWDLLSAKLKHTILIADTHTLFERGELEDITQRAEYYIAYFKHLCKLGEGNFKLGSTFQRSEEYIDTLYKALIHANFNRTKKSLPPELEDNISRVSVITYPVAQAIDSIFLKSQVVYAGMGQRRIYVLAREILPKIGFKKPTILLSDISHDIKGNDLAKPSLKTRINIHDNEETLKRKIKDMFAPEFVIENNPLIETFEFSIIPWFKRVEVKTGSGKIIEIESGKQLKELYKIGELHPKNLKETMYDYLKMRLEGIAKFFDHHPKYTEWINFEKLEAIK